MVKSVFKNVVSILILKLNVVVLFLAPQKSKYRLSFALTTSLKYI